MIVAFELDSPLALRICRELRSSNIQLKAVCDVEAAAVGPLVQQLSDNGITATLGVGINVPFNRNVPRGNGPKFRSKDGMTVEDTILEALKKNGARGTHIDQIEHAVTSKGYARGSVSSKVNTLLNRKKIKRVKPATYAAAVR